MELRIDVFWRMAHKCIIHTNMQLHIHGHFSLCIILQLHTIANCVVLYRIVYIVQLHIIVQLHTSVQLHIFNIQMQLRRYFILIIIHVNCSSHTIFANYVLLSNCILLCNCILVIN
jgi:hypothetical protein